MRRAGLSQPGGRTRARARRSAAGLPALPEDATAAAGLHRLRRPVNVRRRLLGVEELLGVGDEPVGVLEVGAVVRVRVDDQLGVRQELLEDVRVDGWR
jgi:hypothetical protein